MLKVIVNFLSKRRDMKTLKRKDREFSIEELNRANAEYGKIGKEVQKLEEYATMLCPIKSSAYISSMLSYHNPVLYEALSDRVEKLLKQQQDITC